MKPSVLSYGVGGVLAADISAAVTSVAVESGGSAFPASDFQVQIGHEIVFVATRSGNTFSDLTRGVEGTTAVAHNRGEAVERVVGPQSVAFLHHDVCELIGAGVPVDYTDGTPPATGEGTAGPGSRYTDITGAKLYLNTGTKAQPAWTVVGAQS